MNQKSKLLLVIVFYYFSNSLELFTQMHFGESASYYQYILANDRLYGGYAWETYGFPIQISINFNSTNNQFLNDMINYDKNNTDLFVSYSMIPGYANQDFIVYLPLTTSPPYKKEFELPAIHTIHSPENASYAFGVGFAYRPFSKVKYDSVSAYDKSYKIRSNDLMFIVEGLGAKFITDYVNNKEAFGKWFFRLGLSIPIYSQKDFQMNLLTNLEITEIVDKDKIRNFYQNNTPPMDYKSFNFALISYIGPLNLKLNYGHYYSDKEFQGLTGDYYRFSTSIVIPALWGEKF